MKKELKILLTLLGVVALVFTGFGIFYKNKNSEKSVGTTTHSAQTTSKIDGNLIRPDSPIQGPENARVILVEFLDPECESCRAFYPTVKKILKEYEGQIRFVVRYMTFHSNSVLAASATEAAGEQGKYWEMQDLLFTRQPEWSHKEEPQKELMTKYAQELGLNVERFAASLSNMMYLQKFERDKQDGIALGVTGTPTFFINGKKLENLSYDDLKSQIDSHLKASN